MLPTQGRQKVKQLVSSQSGRESGLVLNWEFPFGMMKVLEQGRDDGCIATELPSLKCLDEPFCECFMTKLVYFILIYISQLLHLIT